MIALAIAAALAIGLDDRVGAQVPTDLPFTDSAGAPVTLARYFQPGRPVVLVLAYARCRMLCSVVLRGVADAIDHAPLVAGRDYLPIVVSLDPRELPAEAAERQRGLVDLGHVAGPAAWPYLVGNVRPLAAALGFHYSYDDRTEQYAHPAVVFVLSPDGKLSSELRGVVYPDLADAIARARAGQVVHPEATDLLRCFHFDPALRLYGGRLALFFRGGAVVVLLSLVVGLTAVVRAHTRRRR